MGVRTPTETLNVTERAPAPSSLPDDPDSKSERRGRPGKSPPTGITFVPDLLGPSGASDNVDPDTEETAGKKMEFASANETAPAPAGELGEISIKEFYDTAGWSDDDGVFQDTRFFTDNRPLAVAYNRRCMRRLNKHFKKGGRYLLDAGGGAIPHPELLEYDKNFEKRICVDLSERGLTIAQKKLGSRGICMQGDITDLPLPDGSVDAVTCNHVIYQIPPEHQPKALEEIWRVLKPGGVAVIVYRWPYSALEIALAPIARLLTGPKPDAQARIESSDRPKIPHAPQLPAWFRARKWPFRYKLEGYRILSHEFMKANIGDNWRGALFLRCMSFIEVAFPYLAGRYGAVPTLVIRKET